MLRQTARHAPCGIQGGGAVPSGLTPHSFASAATLDLSADASSVIGWEEVRLEALHGHVFRSGFDESAVVAIGSAPVGGGALRIVVMAPWHRAANPLAEGTSWRVYPGSTSSIATGSGPPANAVIMGGRTFADRWSARTTPDGHHLMAFTVLL